MTPNPARWTVDSHLCALTGTRPALPERAQRCTFTSVEAPSLPEQLCQMLFHRQS